MDGRFFDERADEEGYEAAVCYVLEVLWREDGGVVGHAFESEYSNGSELDREVVEG